MRKHETVNSSKVHEIKLYHTNLSSSSLASCENDNTEAQYLIYSLNNYELTLGKLVELQRMANKPTLLHQCQLLDVRYHRKG